MKMIIRTVCLALAVVAFSGCKSDEEYQKLQDKCTATDQQLARAQQDIAALQSAIQQKDADLANATQQCQAQKVAYESVIKRQAAMLEKGKGTTTATKPAAKAKAGAKAAKKPAAQ